MFSTGGAVPQFELNVWRFGTQCVISIPFVIKRRCQVTIPRPAWLPMVFALLEFIIYNASFYSAPQYLPVATMQGSTTVVTLVINVVLSICIKSERKTHLYLSSVVCSAGILLMIQPMFMFANANLTRLPPTNWTSPCFKNISQLLPILNETILVENSTSSPESSGGISNEAFGYILVLISGSMVSVGLHVVKISMKYITFITYSFWTGLIGAIFSAILMFIFEEPAFPTRPDCIGYLLIYAVGTAQSAFIFPLCLTYVIPSVYGLILATKLVILVVLQYTWLSHIQPGLGNWVEILGAIVCLLGSTLGPMFQLVKDKLEYNKAKLATIETIVEVLEENNYGIHKKTT